MIYIVETRYGESRETHTTLTAARKAACRMACAYGTTQDDVYVIRDSDHTLRAWLRRSAEGRGETWYWATPGNE